MLQKIRDLDITKLDNSHPPYKIKMSNTLFNIIYKLDNFVSIKKWTQSTEMTNGIWISKMCDNINCNGNSVDPETTQHFFMSCG